MGCMFEKIVVKQSAASPPSVMEVEGLESTLGTAFPKGYGEFITRFGEGVLGGTYIRIYPPSRILAELEEWRARIDEYWFWDQGSDVLSKFDALNSFILGDTMDGDELIFHPKQSDKIFVLPRYSEDIFVAGLGVEEAIEWLCTSGKLTEPFKERNFAAFNP
jgi:hypothetical protein